MATATDSRVARVARVETVERRLHSWARGGLLSLTSALLAGPALMIADPAFGHDDPMLIPDGNDPVVRWYQPPGSSVVLDWDVEMTPYGSDGAPIVTPAQAFPDESCWAIDVETIEPVRVRVRAVQDGMVSAWSDYTVVPEPGVGMALGVAVPLLLGAASRRRSASSAQPRPIPKRIDY